MIDLHLRDESCYNDMRVVMEPEFNAPVRRLSLDFRIGHIGVRCLSVSKVQLEMYRQWKIIQRQRINNDSFLLLGVVFMTLVRFYKYYH